MAANEQKKVKITLPKARGTEPKELFVGVNGVNYLIPKGKPVEVPDYVAAEIARAQAAEDFEDDEKMRMADEAKKPAQLG